jgi:TPR repeat protein
LLLLLWLGGCTTVPVNKAQTVNGQSSVLRPEVQQERFNQGKALFLAKRYAEAAGILLPLAQQGHAAAQYTIGYMYHYGYGLPRNEKESTRWIAMAAAKGHPLAQEALARINASHDQHGVLNTPAPQP